MRYIIDIHHGLGDVVHFIPAIKMIRENDKTSYIVLIVAKTYVIEFMKTQNLADEYIPLNKLSLLKYIVRNVLIGADYGVVAPCISNQRKAICLLRVLGCRKILFEKDRNLEEQRVHRVERNIRVIQQLGYKVKNKYPTLSIPESESRVVDKYFNQIDKKRKIIAICMGGNYETFKHNGVTELMDVKRWPVSYFCQLILMLKNQYFLLLVGGKKDEDEFVKCKNYALTISENVLDLMGKTTLMQSAVILSHCDLAVGNDTGMIHVAAAIGKPTMAIFCSTDPKKVGAYAPNAQYIEDFMPCKYCYLSQRTFTCKDKLCLTQIKPEKVLGAINDKMGRLRA